MGFLSGFIPLCIYAYFVVHEIFHRYVRTGIFDVLINTGKNKKPDSYVGNRAYFQDNWESDNDGQDDTKMPMISHKL